MRKPHPDTRRRISRPWVVPPGLLLLNEPFEGFNVLDECRSELGVLLWQSLRDVDLWSLARPEARSGLFSAGSLRKRSERIESEIESTHPARPLLEAMTRLLAAPDRVSEMEVSEVCEDISRWASDMGLPRTALAFAQRAALAAPDEAGPAYLVGLVSRRAADYRRAETWLRRTLALSRLNRDWRYYGLAHLALANLHMQRGDAPRARVRLLRALRASRRYGLWSVRSMVLHDLFCITATGEHAEHAEMYARAAFRSYGRRHPRLPVLAHDVARYWMARGHHARAFDTFRAVLPHLTRASDRLLAWANLAQAAGGAGDTAAFDEAWSRVWRMVDSGSDLERVAEALINVAVGAAALGQWVRQEMAASYALQVARRRSEAQQRLKAEELLESARKAGMGRREPEPPAPAPEFSEASGQLAQELVAALSEGWES
jgi:tetratricopeptide (TPR) repeat protein